MPRLSRVERALVHQIARETSAFMPGRQSAERAAFLAWGLACSRPVLCACKLKKESFLRKKKFNPALVSVRWYELGYF